MPQDNFYIFSPLQQDKGLVKTNIHINSTHPIFGGHFPGNPILPGVCMMHMVKEITENYLSCKIKLLKASELKFLSFVVPDDDKLLQFEFKISAFEDNIRVEAMLLDEQATLFKFKGIFAQNKTV